MQIIDLSHTIENGMPVLPGSEQPRIETPFTVDADGFQEKKLSLYSHTGTHVDAPGHIIPGAATLDQLMIDTFIGPAFIVDVIRPEQDIIQKADLIAYTGKFNELDFVLFNTGWSEYWGKTKYFGEHPLLSPAAADWICQFELKGVGIDTSSFDALNSTELMIHKQLLGRGFILIENLTNLSGVPNMPFVFSCMPLKIKAADGSPVRALAILDRL